jgi:predicted enzyme related to lactoylglutathione lyase
MPERTEYPHGTPSWIDLSSTDPDAARSFYGELFGWDFEENPTDQGGSYIMARKAGKSAAGMMQQSPEQAQMGIPPMWNSYVTVDDIEDTTSRVEEAGGSVMMPVMDVMDAGRMAVIVDPTGGVLCLWQPKEHIGSEVVNEHGALTWTELMSPDVSAAAGFYGAVLGWKTESMDMGEGGTYTLLMTGGEQIAGAMAPPMEGIPPHWGVYFAVDDCDACVAQAESLGATVLNPPMDSPPGRMAALADPTGAMFSVIQLAEPSA